MSRKANWWDYSPMESFFKTLKVERIYQLHYEARAQARLGIVEWIEGFFNHRRLHASIGYRTPAHMESSLIGRKCPPDRGTSTVMALLSERP